MTVLDRQGWSRNQNDASRLSATMVDASEEDSNRTKRGEMQHCIMKDPPDGTECGGFEDSSNVIAIAGDNSWERGNQGGTVNYRASGDDDEVAFAALIAAMSVDPGGTDTELCDERARGVITNGTGACGTELEDRYRPVITMGGDDDEDTDAAARFTLIDFTATESHGDHGAGGGGFLGNEEEGSIFGITGDHHIYEGRRVRSLMPCC